MFKKSKRKQSIKSICAGKKKYKNIEQGVVETEMTFSKLFDEHRRRQQWKKPNYQGALDMDRVENMVTCYKKEPRMWRFKRTIIIGMVGSKKYIVDGQHRVEMICRLWDTEQTKDTVHVCLYLCSTKKELNDLFVAVSRSIGRY